MFTTFIIKLFWQFGTVSRMSNSGLEPLEQETLPSLLSSGWFQEQIGV